MLITITPWRDERPSQRRVEVATPAASDASAGLHSGPADERQASRSRAQADAADTPRPALLPAVPDEAQRWPAVVVGVILDLEPRVIYAVRAAEAAGLVLACSADARFACVRRLPRGWRRVGTGEAA